MKKLLLSFLLLLSISVGGQNGVSSQEKEKHLYLFKLYNFHLHAWGDDRVCKSHFYINAFDGNRHTNIYYWAQGYGNYYPGGNVLLD